ncbi:MAG: hypothetical protein OXI71_05055 [Gemmatimonadota bacterium]|nr:hypothetical protein [Gemmatimonadota bacterium]MDE2676637.1 hypothetical protein [Gemmatimonadota bacterium]
MKKTRGSYLIHGIVETGEVRRSDRSEWPEVRITSLCQALERSLNRGWEPPVLWASRASIHLAADTRKAAREVHDLEVGLAWAWIPLVEAWIDEDWARTLAPQDDVRDDCGFEIDEEGNTDEEEHARKWYSRQQQEEYDYNQDWESPWDWAPVDVREDWGFSELDLEEEREGHLPREGPWD